MSKTSSVQQRRPVHTSAPATRFRSKVPSSAPTISSEKICCRTRLLLPSFAPTYQTGWIWGSYKQLQKELRHSQSSTQCVTLRSAQPNPPPPTQTCFHLDLALKLKGINIEMRGRGRRGVATGSRVLGGRGEISTECLNLFATACSSRGKSVARVCFRSKLPGVYWNLLAVTWCVSSWPIKLA